MCLVVVLEDTCGGDVSGQQPEELVGAWIGMEREERNKKKEKKRKKNEVRNEKE